MSKPSGNQTVTNTPDKDTLERNRVIWQQAQQVAGQPYTPYTGQQVADVNPNSQNAAGIFGGVANLANQGASALSGNAGGIDKFMNPYQQNVIDALGKQYDLQRNQAALGANDAATQAGALGGDRNALLIGARQGAIDQQQMTDVANLLYGGYNDAQNRAAQAVNLGLGAAGQQFNAGDYFRQAQQQQLNQGQQNFQDRQNWALRNLGILQSAAGQLPGGSTQSQPLRTNLLGAAAGGAATGGAIGGPIGAGIGAGVGLFGSLF